MLTRHSLGSKLPLWLYLRSYQTSHVAPVTTKFGVKQVNVCHTSLPLHVLFFTPELLFLLFSNKLIFFFFFTILQCFQVQLNYHLLSEDGPIQLSQTELSFLPVCPQHFVLTSFRRVNTVLSFVLTHQHLSLDLRSLKAWGDTFKLI